MDFRATPRKEYVSHDLAIDRRAAISVLANGQRIATLAESEKTTQIILAIATRFAYWKTETFLMLAERLGYASKISSIERLTLVTEVSEIR